MAVNNSGFNGSQVMHMQQDAIRRVREMQRRANEKLQQTQHMMTNPPPPSSPQRGQSGHMQNRQQASSSPPPKEHKQPHQEKAPTQSSHKQHTAAPKQASSVFSPAALLDKLNIDHERALLLLLVVVLVNEQADTKLILALCYLLL